MHGPVYWSPLYNVVCTCIFNSSLTSSGSTFIILPGNLLIRMLACFQIYIYKSIKAFKAMSPYLNFSVHNHMMMILKNVLMWSNIPSRFMYGHIVFRVLDPPILGPSAWPSNKRVQSIHLKPKIIVIISIVKYVPANPPVR